MSGGLSGTVFADANGDGIRQLTEAGLPAALVQVKDGSGEVIRQAITDASGNFNITELDAGSYAVSEVPLAGWAQTAGPASYNVQVKNGSSSSNITFGAFQLGTIGGEVFAYSQDSPRPVGLKGWSVQLLGADGSLVGQTVTSALGVFNFTGLTAGIYQVRQIVQPGWVQTGGKTSFFSTVTSGSYSPYNVFGDFQAATISGIVYQDGTGAGVFPAPGSGGLAGRSVELRSAAGALLQQVSTAADGTYLFTVPAGAIYSITEVVPKGWTRTAGQKSYRIAVAPGDTSTGNDFGDFLGGTVSGTIFQDRNSTGLEVGNPGLAGLTLQLVSSDGSVLQQTTSGSDGTYSLIGLPVGYYTIRQVLPTDWMQAGGPASYSIIVASGSISAGNDFGDIQSGSISGLVFQDNNGDAAKQAGEPGLQSLNVQLLDSNGTVVQQTSTASDGSYSFLGLTPDRYTINQQLPVGWLQTAGPSSTGIAVVNGSNSVAGNLGDFQYGTITGTVVRDAGGGALQGLPNWTIQLTDAGGAVLQQTTSAGNGDYSFTTLTAGTYTVRPVLPAGWTQSTGAASYTIVVTTGTYSTGNNFGDFQPATISGTVFQDLNGDGLQQTGEPGLPARTVQLLNGAGIVLARATTGSSGNYRFTGLQAASYIVHPLTPAGWSHTAGPSSYTVTALSGSNSFGNTFGELEQVSSNVIIDAAWLATQGSAPYVLSQANTTYKLAADVDVPGTAFVIGAANVILDLNGHTVTFGDSAPIQVANGGFEQGSASSVPGWDLTGAPGAVLKPARLGMWGTSMLEIPSFTTAQAIISDPIAIPTANREYAATITPFGDFGTTVTLKVIDTLTGQVLGSADSRAVNRGFGAVVSFTPNTTDPVKLEVDLIPPSGAAATVDLDYAALFAARDYGIVASPGSWYFPAQLKTAPITSAVGQAANFTVQNGSLLQGQGHSYSAEAIDAVVLAGLTVKGVTAFVNGMDSINLEGQYASNIAITASTFSANIDNISDRMLDFAAIHLVSTTGNIVVDGNTILNYPQQGIAVFANSGGTLAITNNKISQRAIVTDGYGIALNGVSDFVVANNTITPVQGRGILFDAWNSAVTQNGDIYGNYVSVSEAPNLEYGTALAVTALRIRNWTGAQRDVHIHGNTFSAGTGIGGVASALGLRVTQQNDIGQATDDNLLIDNNTFKAVVTTTNPSYTAQAVSISGVDTGTGLQISNNVMESNQVSLNIGDPDSYGYHENDILMVGNTMTRSSDGAARTYSSVQVGGALSSAHNVRLIDTHYANGTTGALSFIGSTPSDIETGYLLSIMAQTTAGALAGAAVTIFDNNGTQVYAGTTDSTGHLSAIPLVTSTSTQATNDHTLITTTSSGPFRVVLTFGIISVSQQVDLTADKSLVFNL